MTFYLTRTVQPAINAAGPIRTFLQQPHNQQIAEMLSSILDGTWLELSGLELVQFHSILGRSIQKQPENVGTQNQVQFLKK